MSVKCIFYDCVGPLLIKNPKIKVGPLVVQIDQLCGSAVNDKEFWLDIKKKFNLTSDMVNKITDEIAESYVVNEPMWEFHRKIRTRYKTAVINNGTFTIFNRWIKKYKMMDSFDGLFNSAKLGVRKPDKQIFDICTNEMGVSLAESVLLDDSQYNVDGAISAGMLGVYYQPSRHSEFEANIKKLLGPR